MKIAICDDERAYLGHLCRMLSELSSENRFDIDIVAALSSRDELEHFLKTNTADVYLLDINLKAGMEGYEMALKIRESQPWAYIVFISETLGMVFQSFKAHPFDFLPKPVSKIVLVNLLTDIERDMAAQRQVLERCGAEQYITIRSALKNYRVNKDSIIMIEKFREKAFVYTTSAKITCNTTLEDFEKLLSGVKTIVRCHKGYIVNKRYILQEDRVQMKLILEGGLCCYVSRNYRKRVFE